MRCLAVLSWILLGSLFAGCGTKPAARQAAAPPIELTATLLDPNNIKINWTAQPGAAGYSVEWATNPNENYVILAFVGSETTSYVHPDLAPNMPCYYRVRPWFGAVSEKVEITTGKAPDETAPPLDSAWMEPKKSSATVTGQKSLRNAGSVSDAGPTGLEARLIHPTGIQLTWTDRASDEDGYLLELKTDDLPDFLVCALLDPDVHSFGHTFVPPETKVYFRVRAFYYGEFSNPATQHTGPLPPAISGRSAPETPFTSAPHN